MPRALWSGSINFGLVSVPIKLYSAVSQKDISFHQIDEKSGARIRYKRVSEKTGREVPFERIAKGYEISKDRYVVLDKEELEALDAERTHTIDIEDFVDLDEIDPVYYEHTYYMAPGRGADKAYSLLWRALDGANKVGIGRVVIRTKQYLAAIRPVRGALALDTMLFPDEIVPVDSIEGLPVDRARVAEREMKMARQLIDSLSTEFDPDKYHDEYRARVEKLIARKAKGKTLEIDQVDEERPQVLSLIEALKASVEETKGGGAKGGRAKKESRPRRSSGKRRSA